MLTQIYLNFKIFLKHQQISGHNNFLGIRAMGAVTHTQTLAD